MKGSSNSPTSSNKELANHYAYEGLNLCSRRLTVGGVHCLHRKNQLPAAVAGKAAP